MDRVSANNDSEFPWQALDLIGHTCNSFGGQDWKKESKVRARKAPRSLPSDQIMARHFAIAIAFSQGARSSTIRQLIQEPRFEEAFANFDPIDLSVQNPDQIITTHWNWLSPIRFRSKVGRIVRCATVLNDIAQEHGSFAIYLRSYRIPRRLHQLRDVDRFWNQFDKLQKDLKARRMPFFQSTTSLLQLLLDLDYDSVKPDLIVMRLARRIGITDKETGDKQLRRTARAIQEYAVDNQIRPPLVDLQMLAFGGQTGSRQLLTEKFCPASDPCSNSICPVGTAGLCVAHRTH